jgi:hypothetical protein
VITTGSDQRLVDRSGKPGLITCLNSLWEGWMDAVSNQSTAVNSDPGCCCLLFPTLFKKCKDQRTTQRIDRIE